MATVRAPYPSKMDEIHNQSIVEFVRAPDPAVAIFHDRGGEVEGTFQIRNPEEAYVKALRRLGSYETGYRDVLIKDWARPTQPNVKVPNAGTLPTTMSSGVTWSPDGKYLAVTSTASPYFLVYRFNASNNFTKLSDPASPPTTATTALAWSPDGQYLFVCTATPNFRLYSRSGNTLALVGSGTGILSGGLPGITATGVKWSRDGMYLVITSSTTSPYHALYKRASVSATTFNKLTNLTGLSGGTIADANWSNDVKHLAVATYTGGTHALVVYKRSGTTFTKLSSIPQPDLMQGRAVSYSLDDQYLALGTNTSPYLVVYRRDGDFYTLLDYPTDAAPGYVSGGGVDWTPDGRYVGIACMTTSPYHAIWRFEDETFAILPNLGTAPTGDGYDFKFSGDGKHLAIGHNSTPCFSAYRSVKGPISGAAIRIDPDTPYPG